MATTPLGTALRTEREAKGWSRATLALKSGTSEPAISRTELYGANPRISTLMRWANALEVELSSLVEPDEATAGDAA